VGFSTAHSEMKKAPRSRTLGLSSEAHEARTAVLLLLLFRM